MERKIEFLISLSDWESIGIDRFGCFGGTNNVSDITAVNLILNEKLGFESISSSNFDGLESFLKIVGLGDQPIILDKYNLAYIWLVSENAPKIVQSVDTELIKF